MQDQYRRPPESQVISLTTITNLKASITSDHLGKNIPGKVQTTYLNIEANSARIGNREYSLSSEAFFCGLQFAVTYAKSTQIHTVGVYIPDEQGNTHQISMSDAINLLNASRMAYELQLADRLNIRLELAQLKLHRDVWKIKNLIEAPPLFWLPLFAFFQDREVLG